MAQLSEALKRYVDRVAADAAREDKIHSAAYEAGIIATITQATVSTVMGLLAMLGLYVAELKRQDALKSTGSIGKFIDVASRVLMAIARGTSMRVNDFSCRMQGRPDIIVPLTDKRRLTVEIKTGQGEIAKGTNFGDTLQALETFGTSETYILWYYDLRDFDKATYDIKDVDNLPYIFMRKCDLMDKLAAYNGELDTWLKITDRAVNFQAVTTSNKKLAYLNSLSWAHSYDWIECRDRGNLVEK